MESFERDIAFISNLAKELGNEKKFQRNETYKNFKKKFETVSIIE